VVAKEIIANKKATVNATELHYIAKIQAFKIIKI